MKHFFADKIGLMEATTGACLHEELDGQFDVAGKGLDDSFASDDVGNDSEHTFDDIAEWEYQHGLPSIVGSPRQEAWARSIRFRFLSDVAANIMSATREMDEIDSFAVFQELDRVRAETFARIWIRLYRIGVADATAMIVENAGFGPDHPEGRLAHEDAAQRVRLRASASRKITVAAGAWERRNDLPEITEGDMKCINYIRRCRYRMFGDGRSPCPLETDAEFWLREFRQWKRSKSEEARRCHDELDREWSNAMDRDSD